MDLRKKEFTINCLLADESGKILRNSKGEIQLKDNNSTNELLFYSLFKSRSESFKVNQELIPLSMRNWVTSMLPLIPYSNVFANQNGIIEQELDTYKEMCTLDIKDMEWGVIQKCISLLLNLTPSFFKVPSEFEDKYLCYHTEKGADMIKYKSCPRCDGFGYVEGNKPPEDFIKNQFYYKCVKELKDLQIHIINGIEDIKDEILDYIWNELMSDRDRYNLDGIISNKKVNKIIQ